MIGIIFKFPCIMFTRIYAGTTSNTFFLINFYSVFAIFYCKNICPHTTAYVYTFIASYTFFICKYQCHIVSPILFAFLNAVHYHNMYHYILFYSKIIVFFITFYIRFFFVLYFCLLSGKQSFPDNSFCLAFRGKRMRV